MCEACGTRYAPPTPKWLAVLALLSGLLLTGIGGIGLLLVRGPGAVLAWIFLVPGAFLLCLATERLGERLGDVPGGFPVLPLRPSADTPRAVPADSSRHPPPLVRVEEE